VPDLWTSDIQYGDWLDLVADAQCLPFADNILGNIVMLDVLHHIEFPILFFHEAARKLRPGGRIVMVEPAITWGSSLFYRLIHHEPVDMTVDPLVEGTARADRNPYDSNQALPTLIATKHRDRFHQLLPDLKIVEIVWFSFALYPLSGGFKSWSLIPAWLAPTLLRWERALEAAAGPVCGFRMLLTVEKRQASVA
jgi:SAM-dependent methyltransferase